MGIDLGVDLGTSNVLVYMKGKGIAVDEPSIVAKDRDSDEILAVGEEAYRMMGRTPGNIVAVKPLRDGVISDYEITKKMMREFIDKAMGGKTWQRLFFKPRLVVCVPSGVTEVEKRAVVDAAVFCGAKKTYIIEEPVAAAMGAGLDISQPCGNMIVDIGGGTTDIAVISMGGIVESSSIKTAGNKFDDAVIRYLRKKYNIMIGEKSAEDIKLRIGAVINAEKDACTDIRGRNTVTGLPMTVTVTAEELYEPLREVADIIAETMCVVLEKVPPELSADISDRGIIMTGGGSLLRGIDKYFEQSTGINVVTAENPMQCVALGMGVALENIEAIGKKLE